MIKIQLKHSTYTKMLLHCDSTLIETVFNDIKNNGGKVVIDDKDEVIDEWYIDDYLKLETLDISEKLKVIYVFNRFGDIYYDEGKICYEVLCGKLKLRVADDVLKLWVHNEINKTVPHYELGKLEIPIVPPKYSYTKTQHGYFLEIYDNGAYHTTKEAYTTKDGIMKRIKELEDYEMQ